VTTRTLLLGDWNPWIRDPIDVVRALLPAAALGFLLAGDPSGAMLLAGAGAIAWLVRPLQLPRAYDAAFMVALTLQAGGEALGAYDALPWFDNVAHFSLPFFLAPTLYIALARAGVVSDHSFGSSLQLGLDDTVGDLVADTAGSLCGALLLVCWARYGWGSVRRVPGENRYEATEAG
jgi:hypothetical protein